MGTQALLPHQVGGPDAPTLSPRELLFLQLVARGYTLPQLSALLQAPEMMLEASTVHATHVLGGRTFKEALAKAKGLGLIV